MNPCPACASLSLLLAAHGGPQTGQEAKDLPAPLHQLLYGPRLEETDTTSDERLSPKLSARPKGDLKEPGELFPTTSGMTFLDVWND